MELLPSTRPVQCRNSTRYSTSDSGCSDTGNNPETANATSSAQPSAKTQVARLIPLQDLGLCALLTQSAGAAGDPGGAGIHSSLSLSACPWWGPGGCLLSEVPW